MYEAFAQAGAEFGESDSAAWWYVEETRRHVYRFADQEAYLVVIKGKLTEWECTLRIAELVSDSTDPTVATWAHMDEGPQDRIPPGY